MTPTDPPPPKATAGQGLPSHEASAPQSQPSGRQGHEHHHSAEEMDNEDVTHEHSDVDIRAILAFGAGMVIVAAAAFLSMWVLFRMLDAQAAASDPDVSPVALPAGRLPPMPRLLTNEPAALADLRGEEQKTLESYGWIDQSAGVARIPIAEAKKTLIARGLPTRAVPADPSAGTHGAAMAESSGGRAVKR